MAELNAYPTNIDYWLRVARDLENLVSAVAYAERRADILQEKLTYAEEQLLILQRDAKRNSYTEALSLVERDRVPCEECDSKRHIWNTCGEGTCDLTEPCHVCNADSKLPHNY